MIIKTNYNQIWLGKEADKGIHQRSADQRTRQTRSCLLKGPSVKPESHETLLTTL